ncbi:unnamed protein product [Meganyctiphanes norvegica]|uniref:Uncharacterized protein n=1 Tax=Meganyctiphanes norvegica TaxID=48144 RepID=A0AAV2SUA9_MEGNR
MEYHNNPFSTFLPIEEAHVNTGGSSPDSSPKSAASRSPPNVWLPSYLSDGGHTCGVCADAATGYHYRAMTCEGCKGFFRRTVQRGLSYICRHGGNCAIDRSNRNACQHCRYLRCLSAGMAPALVLSEKQRVAKRQLVEENRERRRHDSFSSEPLKIHSTMTQQDHTIIQSLVMAYNEAFSKENTSQNESEEFSDLNLEEGSDAEENAVWEGLLQRLSPAVARVVTFVKKIPGFTTLTGEDQALLLRGCVAEILFLRTCLRYNSQTQSVLLRNGKHLFRSQVESALGGSLWHFLGPVFELAATVSRLKLDGTEAAMLVALLAIQTDRVGLCDMEKVEGVQDSLLAACKRHIVSSYPKQPIRWSKLVMKLTHIRNVASQHSMALLSTQAMPTINQLVIQLFGEAA